MKIFENYEGCHLFIKLGGCAAGNISDSFASGWYYFPLELEKKLLLTKLGYGLQQG